MGTMKTYKLSKSTFKLIMVFALITTIASCSASDQIQQNTEEEVQMELNFKFSASGAPYESSNIYVAWIENEEMGFIQNITVCERLVDNSLTGVVLPFWKVNTYPESKNDVDAVTSPTIKNEDFTIPFALSDTTIKQFAVYFEIDRANDYNEWFTDKRDQGAPNYVQDQPAILYRADVNLNNPDKKTYKLELYAWTPNDETEHIIDGLETGTPVLETRYITCKNDDGLFGDLDNEHSISRMVESVTLTVE